MDVMVVGWIQLLNTFKQTEFQLKLLILTLQRTELARSAPRLHTCHPARMWSPMTRFPWRVPSRNNPSRLRLRRIPSISNHTPAVFWLPPAAEPAWTTVSSLLATERIAGKSSGWSRIAGALLGVTRGTWRLPVASLTMTRESAVSQWTLLSHLFK